tara:strand:- start:6 stop:203 length:198 start_codon:yes stop_codon:yes gene_type:complete
MNEKVLLITGASSGIGRATALKAAKEGYKLALLARRENKLNEIVQEVGEGVGWKVCGHLSWHGRH